MSARCVECQNEAVERCEVTGVPLCAAHLWYLSDGRRVSESVARQSVQKGVTTFAPHVYLRQLGVTAQLPHLPEAPLTVHAQRNGNDVIALLAGITGIMSLATCFGVGLAACLPPLPLLPLLLGVVGLAGAKHAANPRRARNLSWMGIAGGAGFVVIVLLLVVGSIALGTTTFLGFFLSSPVSP